MNNMIRRFSPLVLVAAVLGIVSVGAAVAVVALPLSLSRPRLSVSSSMPAPLPGRMMEEGAFYAADMAASDGFAGKMAFAPPMMGQTAGATAAETDQRIIKTGSLSLSVAHADESALAIASLASGMGGYIQQSSIEERVDGTKYGSVTIRVPSNRFDEALAEAKKLATQVKSETVGGQDVTEQYTDLQAQLRNAKAQETEYLNILKRAQTVQDILSVQSYLGGVRSQIESLEGRLKYLENQTSYATLSVFLSEDARVTVPGRDFRPINDLKNAAQTLVSVFQGLVTWIIWFVVIGGGTLLPLALVAYGAFRLIKHLARRR